MSVSSTGRRDENQLAPQPGDTYVRNDDMETIEEEDEEMVVTNETLEEKDNEGDETGHFIGIQPEGNRLLMDTTSADTPDIRTLGLGILSILDDQTLIDRLLRCLDGTTLARLAQVSKAMYGFVYGGDVELWRELTLARFGGDFTFMFWWRSTYAFAHCREKGLNPKHVMNLISESTRPRPPLKLKTFFSDVLFQPWYVS